MPIRFGASRGLLRSSPPWKPNGSGAALAGWFDAADPATLTLNATKVAAWANKGAAGGSLAQATASIQPGYAPTGWDGNLPCLTGDGLDSGTVISAAIAGLVGNYWLFVAAERGAQSDVNAGTGFRPALTSTDIAGARVLFGPQRPTSDTLQRLLFGQVGGGTVASALPWTENVKAVLFADLRSSVQVGITGATPGGAGTHGVADMFSDFGLFGDSRTSTTAQRGRHFAGKIGEVMVVNPAVLPNGGSTLERQRFEGYLAWRWGIQASLPADHAYRYGAPRQ